MSCLLYLVKSTFSFRGQKIATRIVTVFREMVQSTTSSQGNVVKVQWLISEYCNMQVEVTMKNVELLFPRHNVCRSDVVCLVFTSSTDTTYATNSTTFYLYKNTD